MMPLRAASFCLDAAECRLTQKGLLRDEAAPSVFFVPSAARPAADGTRRGR